MGGALKLKERFPDRIGDVRGGRRLMTGIEIVSDAQSKAPMDAKTMKKLHLATYEAGAQVRVALNTICLSPPLIITEAEVDTVLNASKRVSRLCSAPDLCYHQPRRSKHRDH